MIPVTLVKTENSGTFLGSFDHINWWRSLPLPLEVHEIIDICWVGGGNHVCAAQLAGGYSAYAIFRSHDNGYSWETELTTAERIFAFCRPHYGICLAATSGGWWRSVMGGSHWASFSTQAPGCFCVKELNNSVLIAINHTSVWKSTNGGENWTAVFSPAGGLIRPAIDGTIFDLLIGIGNKLYYSDDGGTVFYDITNRIPGFSPGVAITDIELTSTFGGVHSGPGWNNQTATFVVQVLLANGMLRHYFLTRTPGEDASAGSMHMFECVAKFDAYSSVFNSLSSDESQTTGGTTINSLVIFTGTDGTNPVMWISHDGGNNWISINTSNAPIYSGPDLTELQGYGGPFIEDTYFSAYWAHGAYCHNGWWVHDGFYRKCQSYDMHMLLDHGFITKLKTYQMGIAALGTHLKPYSCDVHIHNTKWLPHEMHTILEETHNKSYSMNRDLEDTIIKPHDFGVLIKLVTIIGNDMDILLQKRLLAQCRYRSCVEKLMQTDQAFDMILVDTSIQTRVSYIERKFLQPFDIGKGIAPLPWAPYNSKEE
jgi:hypothetical protein